MKKRFASSPARILAGLFLFVALPLTRDCAGFESREEAAKALVAGCDADLAREAAEMLDPKELEGEQIGEDEADFAVALKPGKSKVLKAYRNELLERFREQMRVELSYSDDDPASAKKLNAWLEGSRPGLARWLLQNLDISSGTLDELEMPALLLYFSKLAPKAKPWSQYYFSLAQRLWDREDSRARKMVLASSVGEYFRLSVAGFKSVAANKPEKAKVPCLGPGELWRRVGQALKLTDSGAEDIEGQSTRWEQETQVNCGSLFGNGVGDVVACYPVEGFQCGSPKRISVWREKDRRKILERDIDPWGSARVLTVGGVDFLLIEDNLSPGGKSEGTSTEEALYAWDGKGFKEILKSGESGIHICSGNGVQNRWVEHRFLVIRGQACRTSVLRSVNSRYNQVMLAEDDDDIRVKLEPLHWDASKKQMKVGPPSYQFSEEVFGYPWRGD